MRIRKWPRRRGGSDEVSTWRKPNARPRKMRTEGVGRQAGHRHEYHSRDRGWRTGSLALARLRAPTCRHSEQKMAEFLTGHWLSNHLFNLAQSLLMYDAIAQRIEAHEPEIQRRMERPTPPGRDSLDVPPWRIPPGGLR